MHVGLDTPRPRGVGVNLGGEIGVVLKGGAHLPRVDAKVVSDLVDIAARIPKLADDLPNQLPRPDQEGFVSTGRPRPKPHQRMPFEAQSLAQQPLDQAVARLIRGDSERVEQFAGARGAPSPCTPRATRASWPYE